MRKIPIAGPSITQREIDYVTDAVTRCWYEHANDYHERFDSAFATYVGSKHAVCLPSGTSALHLSLAALGVGPGDEVIVPEATWIASSAPITYLGGTPVFADIDKVTWCISPESVEAAITPRTRAIITVDLYGNMPDYDSLQRIAARHGLPIVEDAAEAFGASYKARQAGTLGRTGTYSFHGSKTITTGEGGMLVTDDSELFERVLFLRDHGRRRGDSTFFNVEVAYKYKLSSMQAALGYAQLLRADEILTMKREAFRWYAERLNDIPGVSINNPGPDVDSTFWLNTIAWDERYTFQKQEAAAQLSAAGLDTRPFFSPLSSLPAYSHLASVRWLERNPVAYAIGDRAINLPSALTLTESDVELVCDTVRHVLFS